MKFDPAGVQVPLTRLTPAIKVSQDDEEQKQVDLLVGRDEAAASAMQPLTGDSASQLPLRRLFGPAARTPVTKNAGCVFCEYVLHDIVNRLHDEKVDKSIEEVRTDLFFSSHGTRKIFAFLRLVRDVYSFQVNQLDMEQIAYDHPQLFVLCIQVSM